MTSSVLSNGGISVLIIRDYKSLIGFLNCHGYVNFFI